MTDVPRQKIARFLADAEMANQVKDVLLTTFLKPRKDMDVHTLAAKSLAIDMLQEAFKEMERYQTSARERAVDTQPGL